MLINGTIFSFGYSALDSEWKCNLAVDFFTLILYSVSCAESPPGSSTFRRRLRVFSGQPGVVGKGG